MLKNEAKNLLSNYENKIDKSKKETREIINLAKKDSEKNILEKTKKFHQIIENKKKNVEIKKPRSCFVGAIFDRNKFH